MKTVKFAAFAAAAALWAVPAAAQDEPEEPRTTYMVTLLDLADGADERWLEMRTNYADRAREMAGLPADTVHWLMMSPDYDIMIVSEMPDGMASFDAHYNAGRAAFMEALTQLAGGEAQLDALQEELDTLIEDRKIFMTHTHP